MIPESDGSAGAGRDGRLALATRQRGGVGVRSNFFWTANRMIAVWVVALLAALVFLLLLADVAGLPHWLVLILSMIVAPVGLIPLLGRLTRQIGQVMGHASKLRPDGTVIPAVALAPSRVLGKELGLQAVGPNASGGSPAALVVLADRVELWSGRNEAGPRWSMSRAGLQIDAGRAQIGIANNWDVVWLSDGLRQLAVSPRYSPKPNGADNDIDRVVRELGQDPAEVRRNSWPERRGSQRIDRRFVVPFYFQMSGANSTAYLPRVERSLVRASAKVTADEVQWLLSTGDWRRMAMGAWFALAVPREEGHEAVLVGMAGSNRDDSALPLAAVSALLTGPDAIGAMETYLDRIVDVPRRDQSFEIVAAAIAHLGGAPPVTPPTWATEAFEELLAVAQDLQQRFRAARA
ncbi:DUF6000 family protein [Promicromonospora umidemergens]|uniref:DUF6000 family protein n=1 Tax=Promicromonospora umidemergens TaxID=629679 RepID=UPI0020A5E044|nr:DUF6000 family protein [Promicromonospora umidemergens]